MAIEYMTQAGLDKLKKDLADALAQRPVISAAIAEAREKGDLSENAEYDAAKDEQGRIEDRIAELEELLKNAEIIPGVLVKVKNDQGKVVEYKIVGSSQADSLNFMLSDESPVGRALKDSKKGDTVKIETPAGTLKYKVMEIWKD